MAVVVETEVLPSKTTPAVIEPRIITEGDIHSPEVPQAFTRIIIARTVCTWSAANSTVVLQIANQQSILKTEVRKQNGSELENRAFPDLKT